MNIIYTDNTLDLDNLARTLEMQTNYNLRLKEIKEAGSTPSEVILKQMVDRKLDILKNDFPYNLGNEYEHQIIWNISGEETHFFDSELLMFVYIRSQITNPTIGKGNLVAIFENTPSKKSVDLKHYHLILRK